MSKIYINQEENYRGEFGEVLRASAIFWVKNTATFKSRISFMNYWKLKRDLKVALIATTRELDGSLIKRERLNFDKGQVINYSNFADEDFEGSVEIDVFALENMVIPYSAIMVVYETAKGVSMVHGYTRTYSRYEVEDKKTITHGEEGCWLLKDSDCVQSFAVVHNGAKELTYQTWHLEIHNHKGDVLSAAIPYENIHPFQTIKIIPATFFKNLVIFLEGQPGSATLSFELGESFTRMLVGHETLNGDDIQVTHSNFNYSRHQTNILNDTSAAIMYLPKLPDVNLSAVVYPNAEQGEYHIDNDSDIKVFHSGTVMQWPVLSEKKAVFSKVGGGLPSRIVTAISGNTVGSDTLPFECSLGVITAKRPPKRLWWGMLAHKAHLKSRLIAIPMVDIYGEITPETKVSIALFGANTHQKLEKITSFEEIKNIQQGIYFQDIFPEIDDILQNDYGYFTFYSDYVGFWVYSSMENQCKSLTLEHGF